MARMSRVRLARSVVFVVVFVVTLCVGCVTASAVPMAASAAAGQRSLASAPRALTGGSSAYNWPTFHHGPQLEGYAANSPLSASDAGGLGVAWATDLYSAALDGPVVAYDASLKETLAYVGTEQGDFFAVNVATGGIVWSDWLGGPIRSTPVVAGGYVWAETWDSARIYKLNASTGAVGCSVTAPMTIEGSGLVVTPKGGVSTLYINTEDDAAQAGPVLAIKTGNCKREWAWDNYKTMSGSWDPIGYAVNATGVPMVLFGSADPDSAVYALNALTGHEVWRFGPPTPSGDYDIGAGVTISQPGVNGFADGVAYAVSKYGILYALNLTTGAQIWAYDFASALAVPSSDISTPALDGTNLVLGYHLGILDVNAVTGALVWTSNDPDGNKAVASPAIAGAPGQEVVAYADLGGGFDVASLADGSQLYNYQTGGYISGSPAVTDGNVLIASSDGFLYDFAVGGGNETALPQASITSPADFGMVSYPATGRLTVSGTASDAAGVAAVQVAVQAGGQDGSWWDAAAKKWVAAPVGNSAALASAGGTSTGWTLSYPVPRSGKTYKAIVYAVSKTGQSGISAAHSEFTVRAKPRTPRLTTSASDVAPGGKLTVTGSGFGGSEKIKITLLAQTLRTVTATSAGRIRSTALTVPTSTPFGPASLTAAGRRSGRVASAAVVVTNDWDQLGDGPAHTGYEPNDAVLYDLVDPGNEIFLDQAWNFSSGGAISTAPAVANEVAYEGNALGQVVAVDVHNGADEWTWQDTSGAAITGSPAVDPAKGLVIVGTADGTVAALKTAAGTLAWSATVGGSVNAPALVGRTVYVTTSNGTVEALAEPTGARRWSATMPASITGGPAVDPVAGTLVTGAVNGDVRAFRIANGGVRWGYLSGGAVTAAPMIDDGTVYFGSGDDIDAVSETHRDLLWSYSTGGAVAATPALTTRATGRIKMVLTGSDDGTLRAINGATGKLLWQDPTGEPITGVATADSVVVFTTSSGEVVISRTYTDLQIWHTTTSTAGISAAPALVDGTVYVGGNDGALYAFTGYGLPPS
jgi:outer membrane protein assembly factor BamB